MAHLYHSWDCLTSSSHTSEFIFAYRNTFAIDFIYSFKDAVKVAVSLTVYKDVDYRTLLLRENSSFVEFLYKFVDVKLHGIKSILTAVRKKLHILKNIYHLGGGKNIQINTVNKEVKVHHFTISPFKNAGESVALALVKRDYYSSTLDYILFCCQHSSIQRGASKSLRWKENVNLSEKFYLLSWIPVYPATHAVTMMFPCYKK